MVVVSIALCKHRRHNVQSIVSDLFSGSKKPEKIIFWISEKGFYLDEGIKQNEIPKIKHPKVSFEYTRNIGSLRKWICPISKFWDEPEKQILILDDDRHIPKDLLNKFINFQNRYPNRAVGGGGYDIAPKYTVFNGWSIKKPARVHCLVPCVGILIKPQFFKKRDIAHWKRYLDFKVDLSNEKGVKDIQIDPRYSDEVYGNFMLAHKGISRYVIPYSSCPMQLSEGERAMTAPNRLETAYTRIAQRKLFLEVLRYD
jgi:hypothetical protein